MPKAKPKLEPEVEEFYKQLLEKGSLSEEETDALNTLLGNEKIAVEFKSGVHARRLTSQEMDKLKKQQTALDAEYKTKIDQLETLRSALASTADTDKKTIASLKTAIEKVEAQRLVVVTKAREYEDGEKFLKDIGFLDASVAIPATSFAVPKSDSFDKDSFIKEIGSLVSDNSGALATFFKDSRKMERKYFSLTGKDLDLDDLYSAFQEEAKTKSGKSYWDVFNEHYDISALESKKQEADIKARIDKAVADQVALKMQEIALPGGVRKSSESVFMKAIESGIPEEVKKGVEAIPLRDTTLSDAITDFEARRAKKEALEAAA